VLSPNCHKGRRPKRHDCETSQRVNCHAYPPLPQRLPYASDGLTKSMSCLAPTLDVLRARTWMRDGEGWARPGFHCGALRRHRQENAGRCETPVCFRVIIASSSSFGEIFSDAECTTKVARRLANATPMRPALPERGRQCTQRKPQACRPWGREVANLWGFLDKLFIERTCGPSGYQTARAHYRGGAGQAKKPREGR